MTELPRAMAATVVLAAVAALAAWAIGVSALQSALVASVVVTAGAGYTLLSRLDPGRGWSHRRHESRHQGTRREVGRLSWTLTGRRGVVAAPTVQRLRALAERRLARLGIDVADPRHAGAAAALLGTPAYSVLIADPSRPVRYPVFVRCVAAVEHLDALPASTVPVAGSGSDGAR